jgi:ABC-type antimicrobial peptide transport system permease subunit
MTTGIIIIAIILIIIFALLGKNNEENKNEAVETSENNDMAINEIEEQFFNEVNNGKEKYRFLKIDNQFDLMFIKSLFQSEDIPYYVEFENISRIRPGMYVGDLGNYNLLYILDDDYNDALKIVKKYIRTKKENKKDNENKKENIRNLAEVLFGNWKVPSASDTNGIEVLYKNKS